MKVDRLIADVILDLVQPEVGPFDPPSPKTLPYDQTRSRSDDPLQRYDHLKFSKIRPAAILDLVKPEIAPFYPPTSKILP